MIMLVVHVHRTGYMGRLCYRTLCISDPVAAYLTHSPVTSPCCSQHASCYPQMQPLHRGTEQGKETFCQLSVKVIELMTNWEVN